MDFSSLVAGRGSVSGRCRADPGLRPPFSSPVGRLLPGDGQVFPTSFSLCWCIQPGLVHALGQWPFTSLAYLLCYMS